MIAASFDRVIIVDERGSRRSYSTKEFLALPLDVRIAHILARKVEFFLGEVKIDRADALKSLRR